MIAIVNVGLGNVASVGNMFDRLGFAAELRTSPAGLTPADRYVLPGVGSFDEGVRRLKANGWFRYLQELPTTTHVLGICLGMQLLGTTSEEGLEHGLNRVPAHFERFSSEHLRVPHMGWNRVFPQGSDPLFDPDLPERRYYFTHSYRAVCMDSSRTIATTVYGSEFTSVFRQGNTRGVQFHPEKSHRFGMSLLRRWAELPC
jgi:glutamine amidotransferase